MMPKLASLRRLKHACRLQDIRRSGGTLAEILTAGQWKSIAFLKYLDEVWQQHTNTFVLSMGMPYVPGRS
jgi:hypothetical protein